MRLKKIQNLAKRLRQGTTSRLVSDNFDDPFDDLRPRIDSDFYEGYRSLDDDPVPGDETEAWYHKWTRDGQPD